MLTDTGIRRLQSGTKPRKIADSGGLYLLVNSNGSRWWRLDYRFASKRKTISLGTYPDTSLALARTKRDEARAMLAGGQDPSAERKAAKAAEKVVVETFRTVADEWLELQKPRLAPNTYTKAQWLLGLASDVIGDEKPSDLTPAKVLACLREVEVGGRHETAHRVKARIAQVMRYAIQTGRAEHDPCYALRGALAPRVVTPRAAITDPGTLGSLLRALEGYTGMFATRCALRLLPLLFVRPGELRHAEWSEFDLPGAIWRMPAGKTKMRAEHLVPLSTQAVAILHELYDLTGDGKYLFPSTWDRRKPMCENTINAALRRMGYGQRVVCGHGFRASASTMLNEQGWSPDVIERQLAHKEVNQVRAVYNRAQYLQDRIRMMQHWSDYLDRLRAGVNVVKLKQQA